MPVRPRPKRLVAIDWDPRTLRIVHAQLAKRGLKIERLLSVAIPGEVEPDNPRQMGAHIRRTLDQEGISVKHAIVDVPRDQAILKTLKLPTAQRDGLPGMVEIQIAKELPFPAGDAVIDFTVEHDDPKAPTGDVLVAAIRRELLEQYQATFEAAGLKLDRVGLRPYANKVAIVQFLRHALPERVLIIDVRPTFMEIDVLREGALVFSRSASVSVPEGLEDTAVLSVAWPEPEMATGIAVDSEGHREAGAIPSVVSSSRRGRVIDSLMVEVTRSIEAYRASDPGATIDHVVVGGDAGVEEALLEAIQSRLKITAEMYNPASTFGWEPDEGAGASAFAASLGLVVGHAQVEADHFDFLHPKRTESTTQRRLKKAPLAAAVAVLFISAGVLGLNRYTAVDRAQLAKLEKEIGEMEGRRAENKKFVALVEELRDFDQGQLVWVDVLHEVFSLLPSNSDILVNNVEVNQKDRQVTLKTQAKRRETATDLIHKMESFRREHRENPRFKVRMGPQTEKMREKYPFFQDFRISLLDDGSPGKPKDGP